MPQILPTIVIGLGGSGSFVVRRLRKRLAGRNPGMVKFLCLDTDPPRDNAHLSDLADDEFMVLDDFDGDAIVNNLGRYPEINAWWKYQNLYPGFISAGAGQMAPFGRLAFFHHFRSVSERIDGALQTLFTVNENVLVKAKAAVDVHIVASSCGGTGAGMILDVAAYCAHTIRRLGKTPRLQSYLFTPACFANIPSDRIQANGAVFLRQLECVQRFGWPKLRYPGGVEIEHPAPLFFAANLISPMDFHGMRTGDLDQLYEKVALRLDLAISSSVTDVLHAGGSNIPPNWSDNLKGRRRGYGSFSAVEIAGTGKLAGLTYAPALVRELLTSLNSKPDAGQTPPPGEWTAQIESATGLFADRQRLIACVPEFRNWNARIAQVQTKDDARLLIAGLRTALLGLSVNGPALDFPALQSAIDADWRAAFGRASGLPIAAAIVKSAAQAATDLMNALKVARQIPESQVELDASRLPITAKGVREYCQTKLQPFLQREVQRIAALRVAESWASACATLQTYLDQAKRGLEQFPTDTILQAVQARCDADLRHFQEQFGSSATPAAMASTAAAAPAPDFRPLLENLFRSRILTQIAALAFQFSPEKCAEKLLRAAIDCLDSELQPDQIADQDWSSRAAMTINNCQPMIQLSFGFREHQQYSVARVWQFDQVKTAYSGMAGLAQAVTNFMEDKTPGHLEAAKILVNFPLWAMQEFNQIEAGFAEYKRVHQNKWDELCIFRGPASFWNKFAKIRLAALTAEDVALARALALYVFNCATELAAGYRIQGELEPIPGASWHERRAAFGAQIESTGMAESLLDQIRELPVPEAREKLQLALSAVSEKINSTAQTQDWEDFIAMLREEKAVVAASLADLPA